MNLIRDKLQNGHVCFLLQSSTTKTIIKTIPSSMLSMAKAGTSTATTPGGAKTIVIAAPKGSTGGLTGTPHKIITSVPKIAGQGNTQFIVVSPQSSVGGGHTITSGGGHCPCSPQIL